MFTNRCMLAPCLLLFAFCGWAQQAPEGWNLEQLMGELAQRPHGQARFTETKYLRLLSGPLTLTGTLSYRAPDRLEKHTLTPTEEVLIVQGDQLSLEIKARGIRREIALQEHPVLWGFVESIRSTLGGDLNGLKRFYDTELTGERGKWQLTLTPRDRKMKAVIRQIRIEGAGGRVGRVQIEETGGDRSVMAIREEGA